MIDSSWKTSAIFSAPILGTYLLLQQTHQQKQKQNCHSTGMYVSHTYLLEKLGKKKTLGSFEELGENIYTYYIHTYIHIIYLHTLHGFFDQWVSPRKLRKKVGIKNTFFLFFFSLTNNI
jgi:hypothetical protein